jgi:hypothetical protein
MTLSWNVFMMAGGFPLLAIHSYFPLSLNRELYHHHCPSPFYMIIIYLNIRMIIIISTVIPIIAFVLEGF